MLEDGDTMIHLSKSYFALMDGKFIVEGRMSWAALEPIRTILKHIGSNSSGETLDTLKGVMYDTLKGLTFKRLMFNVSASSGDPHVLYCLCETLVFQQYVCLQAGAHASTRDFLLERSQLAKELAEFGAGIFEATCEHLNAKFNLVADKTLDAVYKNITKINYRARLHPLIPAEFAKCNLVELSKIKFDPD